MWSAFRILVGVIALLHLTCPPPLASGWPIQSASITLGSPSPRNDLFKFVNSPLPNLERAIRMITESEGGDDDKPDDAKDEAKAEEKPDEEKKEEIDEDLKSDEEKDDPDDDDDDDDDDDKKKEDDTDSGEEVKSQADHKLLVILVDGFRYDYVKRDKALKGFPRMAKQGVYAKEVEPVHPSRSYPNYYSILTGLYPESHGFIDNYIRDKPTGDIFLGSPHPNASNVHWWDGAEPLWVTAEKHRIKTAVYGWDGCQVKGENPKKRPPVHVCEPYGGYPGVRREKEQFRGWLEVITEDFKEHKYRLAMTYYESVDYSGHKFGPQSKMTKQAVRDIDEILYDLQDMLTKKDLDDEVNVYVLSDHGMIDTKKFKEIELDDYIDMNDVELVLGAGAVVQLLAEKGKHSEVYKKLRQANIKGLNVYEKSTVPERFHVRSDRNLLAIYLTADKGYQIVPPAINAKVYPDNDIDDDGDIELPRGNHGYDPDFVEEMDGIMYAYGPDIRDGTVIEEMDMVDHYGVLCHLLGLEPRPNNGTVEMYDEILNKFDDDSSEEEKAAGDDKDDDDDDSKEENDKKAEKKDGDDDDDDDDNGSHHGDVSAIVAMLTLALAIWLQF